MTKTGKLALVGAGLLVGAAVYGCGNQDGSTQNLGRTASRAELTAGRDVYVAALRQAGLKPTDYTRFKVAELQELVAQAAAAGVQDLKFYTVVLATQADVDRYVATHPELLPAERAELLGRQMIVIGLPEQLRVAPPGSGPDGGSYLTTGTLCPPPALCDGDGDIDDGTP
jgi:hypothetical protein